MEKNVTFTRTRAEKNSEAKTKQKITYISYVNRRHSIDGVYSLLPTTHSYIHRCLHSINPSLTVYIFKCIQINYSLGLLLWHRIKNECYDSIEWFDTFKSIKCAHTWFNKTNTHTYIFESRWKRENRHIIDRQMRSIYSIQGGNMIKSNKNALSSLIATKSHKLCDAISSMYQSEMI